MQKEVLVVFLGIEYGLPTPLWKNTIPTLYPNSSGAKISDGVYRSRNTWYKDNCMIEIATVVSLVESHLEKKRRRRRRRSKGKRVKKSRRKSNLNP